MNLPILSRRGAIAAFIIAIALVVFFAPAPVSETVFGCTMIIGTATFAVRDQQRTTAQTTAILREAQVTHERAEALLGKRRKPIVS